MAFTASVNTALSTRSGLSPGGTGGYFMGKLRPGQSIKSRGVGAIPMGSAFHSGFNATLNYRVDVLPEDADGQVAATIALMTGYVLEDAQSADVMAAVSQSGANLVSNQVEKLECLYRWVQGHMNFVADENTAAMFGADVGQRDGAVVEVLVRPVDHIDIYQRNGRSSGDCDDYSMLLAAMCLAAWIPVAFVTVAADARDITAYSHVYVAADVNGYRVPLDASHGKLVGWEVPNMYGKRADWPVSGVTALGGPVTVVGMALLLAYSLHKAGIV